MSRYIGFLVVGRRSGFLIEGKNHAAKIFETQTTARRACKPLQDQAPVPVTYDYVVKSLLAGTAFCFDSADSHVKFIKCLRNDQPNKTFLEYSKDQSFIRWRHSNEKPDEKSSSDSSVAADAPVQAVSAGVAPVEAPIFNPSILVR